MSKGVSVRTEHSARLMGTTAACDLHPQMCNNGHQSILHSSAQRTPAEQRISNILWSFTPEWIGAYREAKRTRLQGRRVGTLILYVIASRGGGIKT